MDDQQQLSNQIQQGDENRRWYQFILHHINNINNGIDDGLQDVILWRDNNDWYKPTIVTDAVDDDVPTRLPYTRPWRRGEGIITLTHFTHDFYNRLRALHSDRLATPGFWMRTDEEILNLEDEVVTSMFKEESLDIIGRNGYDRGGELDEWLDRKKRELTIETIQL